MNATCALGLAFLRGDVITIKTAFRDYGISNLPREVGRSIERKFGLQLSKVKKTGKSRYGVSCYYYQYRLPVVPYNEEGRKRLNEYCVKNSERSERSAPIKPKTKQLNLL
jgi:hypothetical protein